MERVKGELRKYGLLYLTIVIVILAGFVCAKVFATRPSYVYDWEGLLTDGEIQEINSFCAEVDANTTVEIVTITLKSFDEPLKVGDIDEARVKYFNDYPLDGVTGIGKEGEDNGVLLIFSMNEGDWGIEIGYGLEGDFTDSESGRIGRDILVEYLKDEKYGEAVLKTVQAIAGEVGYGTEDVVILPDSDGFTLGDIPFWAWVVVVIIILALLWFVDVGGGSYSGSGRSRGGRGGSSRGGGGGGSGGGGSSGRIRS